MLVFGPVPSRRLGSSIGINHIPPKHCSYSCIYCQVGHTDHMEIKRSAYYPIDQILGEVQEKIDQCSKIGNNIDYLTLVPDGEPTLDINLGKLVEGLKKFKIPVAVISNSTLIDHPDVQDELMQADWVSLKVDTVDEMLWRVIDRPHHQLSLTKILDSIYKFRKKYSGILVTETMLISGLNDQRRSFLHLCDYLNELQPSKAYLSIPTRPPAEAGVKIPKPETLQEILQIGAERLPFMDLLFETEVGDFVSTGDLAEDIRSITAVHPLREEALRQMVTRAGGEWKVVEDLMAAGEVYNIVHQSERFYLRWVKQDTHFVNSKKP